MATSRRFFISTDTADLAGDGNSKEFPVRRFGATSRTKVADDTCETRDSPMTSASCFSTSTPRTNREISAKPSLRNSNARNHGSDSSHHQDDCPPPSIAGLKAKKDALEWGERTPSRVFRIEKQPDGTFSRVAVNPETQRSKSAKAWEAKSEVAKVRQSLDLTQKSFADPLEIGLSTLRSWEQKKREPSGAAAC